MIYISGLAYEEMTSALAAEGFKIRVLSPSRAVSQGISMHPDIFMCKLGTAPKTFRTALNTAEEYSGATQGFATEIQRLSNPAMFLSKELSEKDMP